MRLHRLKRGALILTAATGLLAAAGTANAAVMVDASVGGAATGTNYVNFDNLALGGAGGASGGVGVSFTGDGGVVSGSTGIYAAPVLSSSNGVPFGDSTVMGADTTHYLTSGIGAVTLTFPGLETYIGLLWGSVDTYNKLELFNGSTLVGSLTGTDVVMGANGNQSAAGTFYANIRSTLGFNKVVASANNQYAFELDNVAFNGDQSGGGTSPVPEPASLALLGLGMLAAGAVRRRKRA